MEPSTANNNSTSGKSFFIGLIVICIVAGLVVGFVLTRRSGSSNKNSDANATTTDMVKTDKVAGSTDTKAFPDSAKGTLQVGGLNGEGTHKLERDGGPSQTVYLISSVVDLNEFAGKKVEIWGQTLKASKVPWLMDVGRVMLLE